MKYKITITKVEQVTTSKRGDYTVIDHVPWTNETLHAEQVYGKIDDSLKSNPMKEIRGYTPSYPSVEVVETKVLEQTVETLDLVAVIKAVNGL